jgi:HAMP domain-containing protein
MNENRQVAVSMATSLAQSIIAAIRHELDNANLSVTITAKLDTGSVQAEIGRIQAQVQQAMASAAQTAQANAGTTINYNQTINTTKRVSETATYRGAQAAMVASGLKPRLR